VKMSLHLLEEMKAKISTYMTGPVNSECDSLKMLLLIKSDSNKKSETNQTPTPTLKLRVVRSTGSKVGFG